MKCPEILLGMLAEWGDRLAKDYEAGAAQITREC